MSDVETSKFGLMIPGQDAEWQAWQAKFEALVKAQELISFGLLESSRVIMASLPMSSVVNDDGTRKLVLDGDATLISRTNGTRIVIDSSEDLVLRSGGMIGAVITPGAVGTQTTSFEMFNGNVEIDTNIQIFGYVDEQYTIVWFNGSVIGSGAEATRLFGAEGSGAGGLSYLGGWNADTNVPELSNGSGDNGGYYVVSADGTTEIDGISEWYIGDTLLSTNVSWIKIPGGGGSSSATMQEIFDISVAASDIPKIDLKGEAFDISDETKAPGKMLSVEYSTDTSRVFLSSNEVGSFYDIAFDEQNGDIYTVAGTPLILYKYNSSLTLIGSYAEPTGGSFYNIYIQGGYIYYARGLNKLTKRSLADLSLSWEIDPPGAYSYNGSCIVGATLIRDMGGSTTQDANIAEYNIANGSVTYQGTLPSMTYGIRQLVADDDYLFVADCRSIPGDFVLRKYTRLHVLVSSSDVFPLGYNTPKLQIINGKIVMCSGTRGTNISQSIMVFNYDTLAIESSSSHFGSSGVFTNGSLYVTGILSTDKAVQKYSAPGFTREKIVDSEIVTAGQILWKQSGMAKYATPAEIHNNIENIATNASNILNLQTVAGSATVVASNVVLSFLSYRFYTLNLSNNGTANILLDGTPRNGIYHVVIVQGSSTETTVFNWSTISGQTIWGDVSVAPGLNSRTKITFVFAGTSFYATSAAMPAVYP